MARIVLSDARPLVGLAIEDGLSRLQPLFGEVWVPTEVRQEVLSGQVERGEAAIRTAIGAGWLREWASPVPDADLPDLDEGEAACIRIGMANPGSALLPIDERAGRAVAIERGLQVAGTAAVIGMARQRGLIGAARPVFEALHRSDFRISAEVIQTVLARVGEGV